MLGPPPPFHVTRIEPAGYVHAHALDEATEYLHAMIAACGERVTCAVNRVEPGAINVVLGAHVLDAPAAAALPADAIIFNSERLAPPVDWPLRSDAYRALLATHEVWDYSATNVAALGHARASVIPFLWCDALVRPAIASARAPGDRLLFYGVMTPRRRAILEALAARGVPIHVAGEYGEARDRWMREALAVLNLHKLDDAILFEPIRCFYPLIQGCAVISEHTSDPSAAPFAEAVAWAGADPAQLVGDIARHVADRAELLARPASFRAHDPRAAIASAIADVRRRRAAESLRQ